MGEQFWLVPHTTGWKLAMSPQIMGGVGWSHWWGAGHMMSSLGKAGAAWGTQEKHQLATSVSELIWKSLSTTPQVSQAWSLGTDWDLQGTFFLLLSGCWQSLESHQPPWFGDYCGLVLWQPLPTAPSAFCLDTFPIHRRCPSGQEDAETLRLLGEDFVPRAKSDLQRGFPPVEQIALCPGRWHPRRPCLLTEETQRAHRMQRCANDTTGAGSSSSRGGHPCHGHPMPSRDKRETSSLGTTFFLPTLERIQLRWDTSPALHFFKAAALTWSSTTMSVEHLVAFPPAKQDLHLLCPICLQTPRATALLGGTWAPQHPPALADGLPKHVCFSSSLQGSLLPRAAD